MGILIATEEAAVIFKVKAKVWLFLQHMQNTGEQRRCHRKKKQVGDNILSCSR